MMNQGWLLATVFLPLFPFSMLFSLLARRIRHSWLRAALLLVWPQCGLLLLGGMSDVVPAWLQVWALATALLYAFRALALRDVWLWIVYMSVSLGATSWLLLASEGVQPIMLVMLALTLPLVILVLLTGELEKRFDAAYAGLGRGIAVTQPRLAGLIVLAILAVIATPVFPGFFAMLSSVMTHMTMAPLIAMLLLGLWLLWSWAGMRLLSGLVMGPPAQASGEITDLGMPLAMIYSAALFCLALSGLLLAQGLI